MDALLTRGQLLDDWGEPAPGDLAGLIEARRASGLPLHDYIGANPQEHGFEFPPEDLARIVTEGVAAARFYAPDSRGLPAAREAIARRHGGVSADQVLLTPGTSFAYFAAFRLLCDGGGEVLCPSPTYPLFEDLARIAGVRVRRYHLAPPDGPSAPWRLDPEELRFQITPRTRAIVLVAPHNPTGHTPTASEWDRIGELAREHGLALIVDEVFRDFMATQAPAPRASGRGAPLVLELNGLSKMLSLPAMKVAWMAVSGDDARTRPFLNAAEYLLDSFLPVSDYLQACVPALLREGTPHTLRYAQLYRERRAAYEAALHESSWMAEAAMGGVYLLLRPRSGSIDAPATAARLIQEHGITVHPGEYYELPAGYLVATIVREDPAPLVSALDQLGGTPH